MRQRRTQGHTAACRLAQCERLQQQLGDAQRSAIIQKAVELIESAASHGRECARALCKSARFTLEATRRGETIATRAVRCVCE